MGIESLFIKKETELIWENEINLIDPITKKEFLSVTTVDDVDINKLKLIGNIPKANMLMQQLPLAANIVQNETIKGAYKVVFPEGAVGTMMKYKNGMLGTPLVGSNGKITAHAGLVSLDNVSLTPLMVFTSMSAITGQYFMARIDESLESISKDVKNIINLFYDEKESEAFAAYNFYEYVKKNLQSILSNEILKISTLTNIQSNNNKLYSNILFYSKSINRKTKNLKSILSESMFTEKRLYKMEEMSNDISGLINQQCLAFELLCIGKISEIQVAEIYDKLYCENLIDELKIAGELIDKDIKTLIDESSDVLLQITKDASITKGMKSLHKFYENEGNNKKKQKEFEKNRKLFINDISKFSFDKAKEFIVIDNLVYT